MTNKNEIKCEICNKEFKSRRSLLTHLQIKHPEYNSKDYYDKYFKQENEGICAGCGNPTTYKGFIKGYSKYCPKQGCSNNDLKVRQKISEATKITRSSEQYKEECRLRWKNKSKEEKEKIIAKRKQTCLEIYNVDNPFKSKEIIDKILESKRKNRPDDPTNREKYRNTLMSKYNCMHNWSGYLRDKEIEKWINLWGVDNPMKVPEIFEKQRQSFSENHNGALTSFQIPEIQEYAEKLANSYESRQKALETKTKNNNRSSYEILFEDFLNENNIKYEIEYNKDKRYPFHCDFYLIDYDMFIEINGYWTHNNHFFDKNNLDDLKILKQWQDKAKYDNSYKNAIIVWTKTDILKRDIAYINNLNYIVLWDKNDIQLFFKYFKETYI